jgi:type I restriction enzyme S subunit
MIRSLVVNPAHLALLLDSDFVLARAIANTQSIGVPDLGLDRIKRFAVPICSLDEQEHIVAEEDRRLSVAAAAERQVEADLARAARLRQVVRPAGVRRQAGPARSRRRAGGEVDGADSAIE